MDIQFLGAAGTVTGSKYLLTIGKKYYLVDCGLFQGLKELRDRNWRKFETPPEEIEAIFVTHAHIDHTGYIPRLVKLGFKGPVYCSSGTYDLAKILLPDSGHLQEEEAYYANKKGYSRHKPALPLYTREEAEDSLALFKPVEFHKPIKVNSEVTVTFNRAGHILGASCILLEAHNEKFAFTGDVGRMHDIIMKAPEPLFDADHLVIESTYGDREHPQEDVAERLAEIINATVAGGGVVVIPAFAVGRAQHILYLLHKLKTAGRIKSLDTYLDSPMAINATELYCQHINDHRLSQNECAEALGDAIFTRTPEQSKAINETEGPKIIISASGMATGGRILHHLKHYVSDARNTVILVGYQAAGTRGRDLQEGAKTIKMFGETFNVGARIETVEGLSAHADRDDLIKWLTNSPINHPHVYVTHGERESAQSFAKLLRDTFQWQVDVPNDGETFEW